MIESRVRTIKQLLPLLREISLCVFIKRRNTLSSRPQLCRYLKKIYKVVSIYDRNLNFKSLQLWNVIEKSRRIINLYYIRQSTISLYSVWIYSCLCIISTWYKISNSEILCMYRYCLRQQIDSVCNFTLLWRIILRYFPHMYFHICYYKSFMIHIIRYLYELTICFRSKVKKRKQEVYD